MTSAPQLSKNNLTGVVKKKKKDEISTSKCKCCVNLTSHGLRSALCVEYEYISRLFIAYNIGKTNQWNCCIGWTALLAYCQDIIPSPYEKFLANKTNWVL